MLPDPRRVVDPGVGCGAVVDGVGEEERRGAAARGELLRALQRPEDGVFGIFALADLWGRLIGNAGRGENNQGEGRAKFGTWCSWALTN